MRFAALIILCFSYFLTSCGDLKDPKRKEVAYIRHDNPVLYHRADPNCDEKNALTDLGPTKIWISQQGKIALVTEDFSGVSGHGLQSAALSDTLWDYELVYEHACVQSSCEDARIQRKKPGKRLYFCRKGGGYPRESLENVALASLYGIAKTHKLHSRYLNTSDSDKRMAKVSLLVHPLILDHKTVDNEKGVSLDRKSFRTDNAYWLPLEGISYIVATPEGEEYHKQMPGSEPRLWEMPSIMSHEYGHHLFQQYAPSLTSPLGSDAQVPEAPFKGLDLAKSAINEAFADLIAFHTMMYFGFDWFRFRGFIDSRDISKSRFSDGSYKRLDDWYVHHYFAQTNGLRRREHEPDPTDNHTIGAILAHGAFQLFNQVDLESIGMDQIQYGFQRTIEWAKTLQKNLLRDQEEVDSAAKFLERSVVYLTNAKHLASRPESHICLQTHGEVFPAFQHGKEQCRGPSE